MVAYAIAEVEDGFTIVELRPGEDPESAAARSGGILADPGPYTTYEEATDALAEFEEEEESE
jgi:hypothetical protein